MGWFLLRGRRPPLGIRWHLRRWLGIRAKWQGPCPAWLNPDFAARLELPARLERLTAEAEPIQHHRGRAYADMASPLWANIFERSDPGTTRVGLEVRHPLVDIRLVRYVLSVPAVPWCHDKGLLRAAVRGVLPEEVCRRPKAPLAGDPIHVLLRRAETLWQDFEVAPEAAGFVAQDAWRKAAEASKNDAYLSWVNTRPISLACWLRHTARAGMKSRVSVPLAEASFH
jgi:asparagine synthase (glutamine-hydrolysing)